MYVQIFADGVMIGTAQLDQLDPPMGVASGFLSPTNAYDHRVHASTFDGELTALDVKHLSARSNEFGPIECIEIAIGDWATLGELHVELHGIPYPQYETYFSDNPHFLAYWKARE